MDPLHPGAPCPTWTLYLSLALSCLITIMGEQNADQIHWAKTSKGENNHRDIYTPYFVETDRNISHAPGDRAVLRCRVENLGTKTVAWKKKGEAHPLTIGWFTFIGDTRISVDYNHRTNEWILIIQDVKPSDEGIYQCMISTKQVENMHTYDILLTVKNISRPLTSTPRTKYRPTRIRNPNYRKPSRGREHRGRSRARGKGAKKKKVPTATLR